mmetsp:Transcript_55266/g.157327  ORF Transcript_55266/g.157327 Transcript_55266/m.157327 type:complete len:300 (-) Transcript_55266:445-1344(-)
MSTVTRTGGRALARLRARPELMVGRRRGDGRPRGRGASAARDPQLRARALRAPASPGPWRRQSRQADRPRAQLPQLLGLPLVAGLPAYVAVPESAEAALLQEHVRRPVQIVRRVGAAGAARARLPSPAVVGAGGVVERVRDALGQAQPRLLVADVGPHDLLHQQRPEQPERRVVLAEQAGVGDAPRVQRREDDPRGLVEAPVKLSAQHDAADLAVLVRLRADELATVHHGYWLLHALLQAREVAQVGERRDHPAHVLLVDARRDGAKDDAAPRPRGARLEVWEKQIGQQEVAQVVGGEA